MTEIKEITKKIQQFIKDRDWVKFQNHKDVALSLVLEATEVLEHFQWKNSKEVKEHGVKHKEEIGEELADVAKYLFGLADNLDIDLEKAIEKKMLKDAAKYPINKATGKHTKYKEL